MKNLLLLILLNLFLIQNNLIAQNNMAWVLIENNSLPTGSCSFSSDCDVSKPELCYALIFTPTFIDASTGMESPETDLLFTSYTTFFRIDCASDNIHSVNENESCIMTDNSTETQACPAIEQRINLSANSGTTMVTKGNSYVIHTTCFEVNTGESITVEIREPPAQNVQSNASLGTGGTAITENLDVANLVIDSDAVCATLPVELLFFKGYQNDETITLEWSTATEQNNLKFEILKSIDGKEWNRVGELLGSNESYEITNYSFIDRNPVNGLNYYLLKQIDYDGQFEYSKIITVNTIGEKRIVGNLYPNPSKSGLVNLDYFTQYDNEIMVSVLDMTGKLLINKNKSISNGNNNLSLDFSDLKKGIYIVKIGNERNPTYRKLIIGR